MAGHILGRMFGLESYKDKTTALVLTAQESAYKVLLLVTTFTAVLWMSIFLYASFYYSYMPAISHVRPVHLQFESCRKSPGLCTYPHATVTLTQRQRLLMIGQPYKVVVELELPESPGNLEAGMFLVCGELRGGDGSLVERSCRSTMLHYKSALHNLIATLIYAPFLLLGSAEEKQMLGIELFSGFTEHPDNPATEAYIEIQSQHVHIYQTYLKIHAHFTGLRYFMFHWPFLAASLGISTNFFFLSVIAFLSWYKFFVPKHTLVQVGYDANAARSVEEKRRELARKKLAKEREDLISLKTLEEEEKDEFIPTHTTKTRMQKLKEEKDKLDAKSKLEMELSLETLTSPSPDRKAKAKEEKDSSTSSEEFEVLAKNVEDSSEDTETEDKENRSEGENSDEQMQKTLHVDEDEGSGVRKRKT